MEPPHLEIDTWELVRQASELISGSNGSLCQGAFYGCRAEDALATAIDRLFMSRDEEGLRLVLATLQETEDAIGRRMQRARDRAAEESRLEAEAQAVACPYCGAEIGDWCRTVSVRRTRTRHHRDRLRLARGLTNSETTTTGAA